MYDLAGPIVACLLAAALTHLVLRYMPRLGPWLLAAVPAVCCGWYLSWASTVAAGTLPTMALAWLPGMEMNVDLRLDGLGLLLAVVITGIGAAIVCYAGGYLHGKDNKAFIISWLLVFMAAMLGLVTADNLLFAFVSWEATSIASFMLIGTGGTVGRLAARRAMLITGGGGLALLGGLLLLAAAGGGAWSFSALAADVPALQAHPYFVPGLLLVVLGAATKSALFPFHFWLPGAMAAPTPVSAYLHSATMVKAGVFLLARMHPTLGGNALWFWMLVLMGGATVLWAAFRALQVQDLKALLAYTTLMALGTIAVLLGLGSPQAVLAAVAFLLAHAFYKGGLFMVAGSVDHGTGSRDSEILGGLRRAMPWTTAAALITGLAMAGMPPLGGFAAKELVLKAGLSQWPVLLCLLVGALSFVAVAWSVALRPFWSAGPARPGHPHESPPSMVVAMLVMAGVSVALGLFAGSVDEFLLRPAALSAASSGAEAAKYGFALWHGVGPALFLSMGAIIIGFVIGLGAIAMRRKLTAIPRDCGEIIHDKLWVWLVQQGKTLTYLIQNGSLRFYIIVILLSLSSLMAITAYAMGLKIPPMDALNLFDGVLVVLLVFSTLVMAFARSRLGAVAALGGVGVGASLFFLRYSAPDLALTQFLVDTLTVVMLVLAFRHLPEYGRNRPRATQIIHSLVALSVGAMVTVGVLAAQYYQLGSKVSAHHSAMAYPDAYGRNVVNVILVDFRALDTIGEITVLGIAAVGVLILLRRVARKPLGVRHDS